MSWEAANRSRRAQSPPRVERVDAGLGVSGMFCRRVGNEPRNVLGYTARSLSE